MKFNKLINNKKITFNEVTIFCNDSKILFNYFDLCVYTFNTKKIHFAKNINQLNENTINLIDTNKISELKNSDLDLSNFYFYIPLRNCFLDYIRYKKELKKIKNLNYKFMFSSNFYDKSKHYTNNLKPNFNNKIYFKNIKGLSFRNKIKYFYPIFFSLVSIFKKFNLVVNLFFNQKIIFCGKAYHDSKNNKFLRGSYNFTNFTIHTLNFLKEKNQSKIESIGLNKFKKITKLKKFKMLSYYEKHYLIQSFYRAILFTHLKKLSFFKLYPTPKINLLRIPLLKNTFQIYTDPVPANSINNSRYMQIKKFYPNRMIDFSLYSKNYEHTDKEFLKRVNKCFIILQKIIIESNKKITVSLFLKKNKNLIG